MAASPSLCVGLSCCLSLISLSLPPIKLDARMRGAARAEGARKAGETLTFIADVGLSAPSRPGQGEDEKDIFPMHG